MDFKLSKDEVLDILENKVGTKTGFDFSVALGNTIREKNEPLYVKLVEVTNVMVRKGTKGTFWILTSPEVASVLDVSAKFNSSNLQKELGTNKIQYEGMYARIWRVYSSTDLPINKILIGADGGSRPEDFAEITIANFII